MVIVRPTTLMAAIGGAFPARHELAMFGIQIVSKGKVEWAKKAAWFRNVPYTAIYPHEGQIETRIQFGTLAKEAASMSVDAVAAACGGQVYDRARNLVLCNGMVLPKVAAYIMAKMKGFRAPARLEPSQYPSKHRRTFHTIEELQRMQRYSAYQGVATITA